jgi:hypothetical protein
MNLKAIALAAILGLSAPAIADVAINAPALAQARTPIGMFQDNEWAITIGYSNNAFNYYARNLRTGSSLRLRGAKVGGDNQRRVYTWSNGAHQYQVAWRPSDPNFIRLQVVDPKGKLALNRLLGRSAD